MGRFVGYEPCPRCRAKASDRAGDNLGRYSDGSGHCFSCGYHVFPKHVVKEVKHYGSENKAVLPYDFSREVPARGWRWLLQYGLPYTYWRPLVGWSEHYQRLIFPVGNPIQFSQGRLILEPSGAGGEGTVREQRSGESTGSLERFNGQPKGNQGSLDRARNGKASRSGKGADRKWLFFGDGHGYVDVLEPKERSTDEVVLVEDLISAHKVGQVATCFSLFGTNIHDLAIKKLMSLKRPVTLWLDWDQAGLLAPKLTRLQSLLDLPARHIWRGKDPKNYSVTEIKEILNATVS